MVRADSHGTTDLPGLARQEAERVQSPAAVSFLHPSESVVLPVLDLYAIDPVL